MKTLLLLLIPVFSLAQPKYLRIENNQVIFEKIYTVDSLKEEQVKSLLVAEVPKVAGIADMVVSEEILTATIKETTMDNKKYGKEWQNTALFTWHPMTANVSFYWKEGKYRVVMTNITFDVGGLGKSTLGEMLVVNGKFREWKSVKRSLAFMDMYFDDLFKFETKASW